MHRYRRRSALKWSKRGSCQSQ